MIIAMSIVSNKELAENKLILLYIIDKVNIPISNLQITKIILENKFMNYLCFSSFSMNFAPATIYCIKILTIKRFTPLLLWGNKP